jgi:hypothetical protein
VSVDYGSSKSNNRNRPAGSNDNRGWMQGTAARFREKEPLSEVSKWSKKVKTFIQPDALSTQR